MYLRAYTHTETISVSPQAKIKISHKRPELLHSQCLHWVALPEQKVKGHRYLVLTSKKVYVRTLKQDYTFKNNGTLCVSSSIVLGFFIILVTRGYWRLPGLCPQPVKPLEHLGDGRGLRMSLGPEMRQITVNPMDWISLTCVCCSSGQCELGGSPPRKTGICFVCAVSSAFVCLISQWPRVTNNMGCIETDLTVKSPLIKAIPS